MENREVSTNNIYDILDKIEMRPLMYISEMKFSLLSAFIHGYEIANVLHHRQEEIFPTFVFFQDFLTKKYNLKGNAVRWHYSILYQNNNDEEISLEAFFQIFNEFKALTSITVYSAFIDDTHLSFHHSEKCKIKRSIENRREPLYSKVDEIQIIEFSKNFGFALLIKSNQQGYPIYWEDVFNTKERAISQAEKSFGKSLIWNTI